MKKAYIIILLCVMSSRLPAQITQYFAHRQWNNPAAMGEEVQTDDERKNMFLGVSVNANHIGVHGNYDALLSYAYQLFLSESALAFGVGAGAKITAQNYQSLTNDYDEIDPLGNGSTSQYAFTTQTGIYWHNSNFYTSVYSPAILDADFFGQSGYTTLFGGDDDNGYETPKQHQWELHAQAGRLGIGEWMVQGVTIFTFKGLLGLGAMWQYPMNLAALATLNIGNVKIGYAYQFYNLNQYLVQHEISIKIKFAKRGDLE
ncbi:hypothetical protein AGMMS4956_18710 [Bacteroidia bacterium]|nr:hypothetical protein AGMMS4956_18710 [Bacteroidia bacterium]